MSSPTDQGDPLIERKPGNDAPEDLTGLALRLRIRQQELLAELGVLALQGTGFMDLLALTAQKTAEGLRAEYCTRRPEYGDSALNLGDAGIVAAHPNAIN